MVARGPEPVAAEPSTFQYLKGVLTGPAKPVFVNGALFIAGVVFLQSSLAEFLTPEL